MKILVYFGHPAQYLFLRETIRRLAKNNKVTILIKTKDVLEKLIKNDCFNYINILQKERGKSKISIAFSLLKRNIKIFPLLLKIKPDLLMGGDPSIAQLGKLLNIKRITITEDDYSVIKTLSKLTNPFTETILCPTVCDVGKWVNKKVGYSGYMKLGYLHPNVFTPNTTILEKYQLNNKFVIIRLAKLTAHHDFGIKGLDNKLLDTIISIIENKNYQVYISAEGSINQKYRNYLLQIDPSDMHHILATASLLISDSQSMSVEAAMLGVPSLRYSSFVGRISVLEELEHKYNLTFGIQIGKEIDLLNKLNLLMNMEHLALEIQSRRAKMLTDKIDVTSFLVWFIENYPESKLIMKKDPTFQFNFK